MDIGRNEPCSCGSGKKYKRCCGAPKTDPLEFAAGRIRVAQESAEQKVARYIREELDENSAEDAALDFCLDREEPELLRDEAELFFAWVLYDWEPWEPVSPGPRPQGARLTPAWMTMTHGRDALTPDEFSFLLDTATSPTSFHEIVRCDPGHSLTLLDIYLGSESTVFDRAGSTDVELGDLFYGRVADYEDVSLLVGVGQLVMPPIFKPFLLDIRKEIWGRRKTLKPELLCAEEPKLRYAYFAIRDAIVNPRRPEMSNTDDEPLEFHTLTYTLADAKGAIAALGPLAGEHSDHVFAEAERKRPGGAIHVEFSWNRPGNAKHGGMPHTSIARFKISGSKLTVETNSVNRAKGVRKEIERRLGGAATFVRDERQSLDDALTDAETRPESKRDRLARKRDDELWALPEVQATIAEMTAKHYDTWPDAPLPALNGKTPRAAVKTKEGRERVEALLASFEWRQGGQAPELTYDFNRLRAMLGLPLR